MKLFSLLVLSCLLAIGTLSFTSCGTTPYKATATTRVSVQAAMQLWNAYVKSNHPPVTQEFAVKAAYEKWQAAMAAVCDAGKLYAAAQQAGVSNTSALLDTLNQLVNDAGTDQADIVDLLTKFGVKL